MIPVDILYNRLAVPSLLPWTESVSLVERRDGRASTLTVRLCNADGRFFGAWRATRGDSLALSMPPAAADVYAITKISYSRQPAVVTWEAEGRPATTAAPKDRGGGTPPPVAGALVENKISWPEAVRRRRLRDISERVCAECGLVLAYSAKANPVVAYVARYNETGFHLLDRLCRRYALTLRATAGRVEILAGQAGGEKVAPQSVALPFGETENLSQSSAMRPRSVRSARLDPRSARPVRHSAGDGDGADVDLSYDAVDAARIYASVVAASDVVEIDIIPRPGIVPGCIVDIESVGLREVTEMRYTRTGDAESMSLTVRGL